MQILGDDDAEFRRMDVPSTINPGVEYRLVGVCLVNQSDGTFRLRSRNSRGQWNGLNRMDQGRTRAKHT